MKALRRSREEPLGDERVEDAFADVVIELEHEPRLFRRQREARERREFVADARHGLPVGARRDRARLGRDDR